VALRCVRTSSRLGGQRLKRGQSRAQSHPMWFERIGKEIRFNLSSKGITRDAKRNTPTQQPTILWSSLLRQRPRQCSTLQLTQQGWGNYQELSCSLSLVYPRVNPSMCPEELASGWPTLTTWPVSCAIAACMHTATIHFVFFTLARV